MFWLYGLTGALAFLLDGSLSPAVEAQPEAPPAPLRQSRRIVYGLAALFSIDSFGGWLGSRAAAVGGRETVSTLMSPFPEGRRRRDH